MENGIEHEYTLSKLKVWNREEKRVAPLFSFIKRMNGLLNIMENTTPWNESVITNDDVSMPFNQSSTFWYIPLLGFLPIKVGDKFI